MAEFTPICIDLTCDSEYEEEVEEIATISEITSEPGGSSWLDESSVDLEVSSDSDDSRSHNPQADLIHEESSPESTEKEINYDSGEGVRLAKCIFEESKKSINSGASSSLLGGVDGLTDCFVKHSVKELKELEQQMVEMDAHREHWTEEDEQNYDQIKERYLTVYHDYNEMIGRIESAQDTEAGNPFAWNPINLSGFTDYPELNKAAEALVNRQIEEARKACKLNVELPLFEEILEAISKHPIWTIFLDEDDEFELAEKILKHVASIWKERRFNDFFTYWKFENITDPALSDPELERKLQRNAEISALKRKADSPSTSTKRIRLSCSSELGSL